MPLPHTLSRGLSFGKSKDQKPEVSRSRPPLSRPQASASSLHRSIHKSAFLNGRQPPRSSSPLTSDQILDLTYMLSLPVDTPMLTTSIAKLKAPLSRPENSGPAQSLCDEHTWFNSRWIDELTAIIGEEIGPRLNNLRKAPSQLRSVETDGILNILEPYAHIFPVGERPGPRTTKTYRCSIRKCAVCRITSCKACKLSQFFQNEEAVKALSVCVKGRKKRSRPWPEACAWLDPQPGCGWEMKWKKEGLSILSDRIIIRKWTHAGGQERLTAAMASIQAEVLADKKAVETELDIATRLSAKNERTAERGDYNDIIERKWTVYEDPMTSTETVNLLRKLDMDGGEEEGQAGERRADYFETAYHNLVGSNTQSRSRSSSASKGIHDQSGRSSRASSATASQAKSSNRSSRSSRASSVASWEVDSSDTTLTSGELRNSNRSSRRPEERGDRAGHLSRAGSVKSYDSRTKPSHTSSSATARKPLHDRDPQSWAASYSNLVGSMPQTQSKLSLYDVDEEDQVHSKANVDTRPVSTRRPAGRSRAQSTHPVDSWAVFDNSPLGKGRQTQIMDLLDGCGGGRRAPSWATSHANHSAVLNRV